MSNDIRHYEPDNDWFEDAHYLAVRAVMGDLRTDPREGFPNSGHGRSVQLTIGDGFTILTEQQVLDLISVLSKRVACADECSATGVLDEKVVHPDGSKSVEKTPW